MDLDAELAEDLVKLTIKNFYQRKSDEPQSAKPEPIKVDETAKFRRHSVIVTKDWKEVNNFPIKFFIQAQEKRKLQLIKKAHAETWQENETSIVLKMLSESLKSRDTERTTALERSLLELERKSDEDEDQENRTNSFEANSVKQRPKAGSMTCSHKTGSTESSFLSDPNGRTSFTPTEKDYIMKAIKQNTRQHDLGIAIMIVGSARSGKSSLMNSMMGGKFEDKTPKTFG